MSTVQRLACLGDARWWSFLWRYLRGRTPWDTRITPPEVMAFLETAPPGRALDLGCGTGTNAMTMARRGWHVTGIDFAPQAIWTARRRASRVKPAIDFRIGDVTDLQGVRGPFDYALDIGCLHALTTSQQNRYAAGLPALLRPGAKYMLYAWLPRRWRGKQRGIAMERVHVLFDDAFETRRRVIGEEGGTPTAWYWFVKRAD
ncbi:class I SAM-dependent methyltransferase [Desulfatitalea alkaliphila]|uniref:Class I SAM-dependent methyltransferase n=1 Tax=Desulfatitalea alkaliphila TaxID=2929485 RepID=A0AA41UJ06_9BACT|nr:class I SAM-dependent methyltransferase [Desulfatitalea alkaliphila]MCJ8500082.1 class I SAM-dependent methyltransferase [Desulfatitalea alkaliphila]